MITSVRNCTATGSSPANGSSSTSSSGPCTIAAASCTRWAMPPDSDEILSRAAFGEVELLEQRGRAPAAVVPVEPVEARHPDQQVEHPHVAVQPPLLGHVAPGPTIRVGRGAVEPRQRACVGGEDPEEDPHQGGLAGTVGPEQSHDATGGDVEVDPVEHDAIAEALADAPRRQLSIHHADRTHSRCRKHPARRPASASPRAACGREPPVVRI